MGYVAEADLHVVQREDLVAEHIRATAKKTKNVLNDASGATLLVDEVYHLVVEDTGKDLGKEALETIMTRPRQGLGQRSSGNYYDKTTARTWAKKLWKLL